MTCSCLRASCATCTLAHFAGGHPCYKQPQDRARIWNFRNIAQSAYFSNVLSYSTEIGKRIGDENRLLARYFPQSLDWFFMTQSASKSGRIVFPSAIAKGFYFLFALLPEIPGLLPASSAVISSSRDDNFALKATIIKPPSYRYRISYRHY